MNENDIEEALARMGYEGRDLESVRKCVNELVRRKSSLAPVDVSVDDIAIASFVYDLFASPESRKKKKAS